MPTQKYAQNYIATGNQVKVHVGKFGNVAYATKYVYPGVFHYSKFKC